jgi:superfamily II DNA/RNA helicase
MSFEDMKIPEAVLHGIYSYGFDKPSDIQVLATPSIIEGKDVIAQSQSGTGKTGSFLIGTLCLVDEEKNYPQAIIISNTRELSEQTYSICKELGKYLKKLNISLCVGGNSRNKNLEEAKEAQILIGTPGRINDILDSDILNVDKLNVIVIDEADELLSGEFLDQMKTFLKKIPPKVQTCIFSATLPDNVKKITKEFMNDPVKILVENEKLTLDLITQFYILINNDREKLDVINDLYGNVSTNQCIIYVNSIGRANILYQYMKEKNHTVEAIHSELESKKRLEILKRFRKSQFRVLISTDLTCRGIDVQQVSYVINYDIPANVCSYLHRIGRSGRYKKKGVAINFVTNKDYRKISEIEKYYRIKLQEMPSLEYLQNYLTS